jgi:hypothetical protein
MTKQGTQTLLAAIAAALFWLSGIDAPGGAAGTGTARTVELIADKDNKFKLPAGQQGRSR